MEEKISVNEYVRTKDGIIDKVIIEYDGKCNNPNCSEKHISCKYNYYNEKDIVKHSENLIDLIDKDDYVNGYKVIKLKDGFADGTMELVLSNNTIIYRHHSEDIKTILTRENYMANCYKVGGEDGN